MELTIIQSKIYLIRGHKVMLDFDLAEMYEVETRVLKQAVKRNAEKFPEDFMFALTKKEWEDGISNCDIVPNKLKFTNTAPFAFTEHGVTMLASVLRSERAVKINIAIVEHL